MHTRNKLTAKKVAALTEPGVHGDGGGLYVRIRQSGSRSWIFVRIVDGKRREMGLGSLYDVSLAQAREEADRLRGMFREGRDPISERKLAVRERKAAISFGEYAEPYMQTIVEGYRNDKHRQQRQSAHHDLAWC